MDWVKALAVALPVLAVAALLFVTFDTGGHVLNQTKTTATAATLKPGATSTTQPGVPGVTDTTQSVRGMRRVVVDASECEAKDDPRMRSLCLRDAAVGSGDVKMCARVDSAADRDQCYYGIALDRKDRSICGSIEAEFIRDACNSRTGGGAGFREP